ncbi:hypothetical protein PTKIN_Ptkin09bG0067600 [Pterospermum kingtungense]
MEGQDIINLPASSNSVSETESGELRDLDDGLHEVYSQPNNAETKDAEIKSEIQDLNEGDISNVQSHLIVEADVEKTLVDDSSDMQISDEITETLRVEEKWDDISSGAHSEAFIVEAKIDGSPVPTKKRKNGSPIQNDMMGGISITGAKRPRMTLADQQPSVHIVYNFLTRAGKQKLEELLQKWSEWQAEHVSSSQDQSERIESGEETYFPALYVGAEKPSAVSFWIDNQTRNPQDVDFIPLDDNIVPLYDRGYSMGLASADGSSNLEGGLELKDAASRCFNCGSYSHSLKQCPKPRDNVAVNTARKQHQKSKHNQNTASRSAIRYYQNSQGGKYDDLKPGVLGPETRQLLGLGEFDPPPWLNRMREIGYPPGYLVFTVQEILFLGHEARPGEDPIPTGVVEGALWYMKNLRVTVPIVLLQCVIHMAQPDLKTRMMKAGIVAATQIIHLGLIVVDITAGGEYIIVTFFSVTRFYEDMTPHLQHKRLL